MQFDKVPCTSFLIIYLGINFIIQKGVFASAVNRSVNASSSKFLEICRYSNAACGSNQYLRTFTVNDPVLFIKVFKFFSNCFIVLLTIILFAF